MRNINLGAQLRETLTRGFVTPADIEAIRVLALRNREIDTVDADNLINIGKLSHLPHEFAVHYHAILNEYFLRHTSPRNIMDTAKTNWLLSRIDRPSALEYTLLRRLLQTAISADFALEQKLLDVEIATIKQAGRVGASSVKALIEIITAQGSQSAAGISRAEAEVLFDINDLTEGANNHASWRTLFVGGIANHLMVIAVNPSGERSYLQKSQWLNSNEGGAENLVRAVQDAGPSALARRLGNQITSGEAQWLSNKICADNKIGKNEHALLQFLQAHCASVHKVLHPLMSAA